MARKTPTVSVISWGKERRAEVQVSEEGERGIRLESAGWWAWLEEASTHSFAYPVYDEQVGYIVGFLTVRKERRSRGSEYWVAYRRTGGRLRKIYLGRANQLTQRQLAGTAARFLAMERAAVQGAPKKDGQKEVLSGQLGGALLEREAMMRRVESGQRVVHIGRR
jgi:hypothetical protein